jgi:hypothetical protein|tara:strand:+ start:2588 stop:2812 length:225 start_codon:yes stop_codon:yes gene_type:complete
MQIGDLITLNEEGMDVYEALRNVACVNFTTGICLAIEGPTTGPRQGLIKVRWLNDGEVDIAPANMFEVMSSATR